MTDQTASIDVLQVSVDDNDVSEFRFLVDNALVKYVSIDTGIYTVSDMCFAPSLIPQLPTFPVGNWNVGHIAKHPETGQIYFERTSEVRLPGVSRIWHTTQVDHLELVLGERLHGNVYEATSTRFTSTVIAKFAQFPWQIPAIEAETTAYQWLEGQNIGPKFLGHVTEKRRVIGFIVEKVEDGKYAYPEDLPLCREALSRLHSIGIRHGDVNRHNFIVQNGQVTLVDFECARKCEDPDIFKEEAESLLDHLNDTSGRGRMMVVSPDSVPWT